jgi:hypothetical protein
VLCPVAGYGWQAEVVVAFPLGAQDNLASEAVLAHYYLQIRLRFVKG